MANRLVGLRPVNPLSVDVTSAVLEELAKLDLLNDDIEEEDAEELTDGLDIKAAIENNEAFVLTSPLLIDEEQAFPSSSSFSTSILVPPPSSALSSMMSILVS